MRAYAAPSISRHHATPAQIANTTTNSTPKLRAALTLINSTVARNSNNSGLGGGIATERGSTITLRNTLIAANVGAGGGSDNCIVEEAGGAIVDGGGNLDDGASCGFTQTTSQSNATAGLAAGLQNNQGPTDTIALTAASAAIDRGLNDVCAAPPVSNLDQRRTPFVRPTDGNGDGNAVCDIGAFESAEVAPGSNLPPVVTNPGNQTGVVGANVNLAISASDPNGNILSYSATSLPAGLSINPSTGVVTGTLTTAGTSSVTVTVSDGQGGRPR